MHLRSIYYKFVLGYFIFGLLGFISISTIGSRMILNHLLESQVDALYNEATVIAEQCSSPYQGSKVAELSSVFPQLQAVSVYLKADIWVVNRKGTIILDSDNSARSGITLENFEPPLTDNKPFSVGSFYNQFDHDVISVSAPITGNYNTYGYILIHMPLNELMIFRSKTLDILYISGAILFGLSLIIMIVFTRYVYGPLNKITAGANEYAAGNLGYTIQVNTQDEIGYLAATLNYMSGELNQMEEYQRNFIANVSHDFRSPLTSIKGYLEAIIDGTIPVEMQEKYLKRVISETDRLNKLTEGMLTLNSLDSKGYLSRTNFDINRVIKDTAASFEGICNTKGITFELTFSDNIQMVYADLGKIQQVLYNLIDNAIKFSHHDSTIYIQASVRHEKVFVSVKDTGIGIPKDSIKKIWERFYKSDISRGKDKRGTGLGLAIVKEVIQSHGENIDVVSTEKVGTEFIFSLPRSTNL